MSNRIVLIGFPGSGKSTVGKTLARAFGYTFIDLDEEIEQRYHTSIPVFFDKFGENAFRACEHAVLKDSLQKENIVLATGGGAPCFFDAMQLINENSLSIYIQLSPKSLFHRLINAKKKRPLVKNKTPEELLHYIEETLPKREEYYTQAKITVKGESINLKELEEKIRRE